MPSLRPRPIVLVLLLAAVVAGCSKQSPQPTLAPNVTAEQRADASAAMRLAFPPEAKFLLYHRAMRGTSRSVYAKIELPAASLATFLIQPVFFGKTWDATSRQVADEAGWPQWQPSTAKAFRSAQLRLPRGELMNVLIDDSADDLKTVYLFWAET